MPWAALMETAEEAEAIGTGLLFSWDHFFGPGSDSRDPHFECWTLLAAWAAGTSRIELGPLVSAIGYRNPDLVADMARTMDRLSGGRFVLGLGAGFKVRDYAEYGYDFGTSARRITDLAHGLPRIRERMARLNPPPLRPIPILIGGSSERRTLRVAAEHASVWHTFADGADFARKSSLLDEYCRQIGRNPGEIERAVLVHGDPTATGDPFIAAGATLFVVTADDRPAPNLSHVTDWVRWREHHKEQ